MPEIKEWVLRKPEENRLYSTSPAPEYITAVTISKVNRSVDVIYTEFMNKAKVIKGTESFIQGLAHGLYITTGIHFKPVGYEKS